MADAGSTIDCYYCGTDLSDLSLPLGRQELCRKCGRYLHVCRMCRYFDQNETSKQCTEDDAEQVQDKTHANFCAFFAVTPLAYDKEAIQGDRSAREALDQLFNDAPSDGIDKPKDMESRSAIDDAEDLFR